VRADLEQARREAKKPKAAAAGPEVVWEDAADGVYAAEVRFDGSLRDLSDQVRRQQGAKAVVLAAVNDGKVAVVVNLDASVEANAVEVVRGLGGIIGGGGGGRPTLAEAGGKNVDAVRQALEAGRDALVAALG